LGKLHSPQLTVNSAPWVLHCNAHLRFDHIPAIEASVNQFDPDHREPAGAICGRFVKIESRK
jgi:hypothetical protein